MSQEVEEYGENWIVIQEEEDSVDLAEVYWWWMPLLLGILIVLASILVVIIMYLSKQCDSRGDHQERDTRQEERYEKLKSNLTCKPWRPQDAASVRTALSESDEESAPSSLNDIDNDSNNDEENQQQQQQQQQHDDGAGDGICKDGSMCTICKKEFEIGQPVYESNNPRCHHVHHKVCMDKWLSIQNSCPICNEPFVLQTV